MKGVLLLLTNVARLNQREHFLLTTMPLFAIYTRTETADCGIEPKAQNGVQLVGISRAPFHCLYFVSSVTIFAILPVALFLSGSTFTENGRGFFKRCTNTMKKAAEAESGQERKCRENDENMW